MQSRRAKTSYTIFCSTEFRRSIEALATQRGTSVAELARATLLLIPRARLMHLPDPGDAPADERDTVILKSGTGAGRTLKRKPRLQVRLAEHGLDARLIRRALNAALILHEGRMELSLSPTGAHKAREDTLEHLRDIISALSFSPLPQGVRTRDEALWVLGFPPAHRAANSHALLLPSLKIIRDRYKMLAMIYHPDSPYAGHHERMTQINQAWRLLEKEEY